ncbi:PTS sugar transporter subunit IIA [Aeromonas sp. FDAARGOS 1407]|uniref:PTS sugar transporter subunit IIA n=1 Tax=Aeromonas TaxID=642 RepID=UPI001C239A50|nr:PTS sugar transporter subunit IIA [Aeromonas sp. FDAARGOS 1407]QXC33534.1 PTS sugar transporter subunit IIA [Aeromonas sp. FDAARGOS 1407]
MLPTMTNDGLICLALRATSKDALFDEMAELLVRDGAVSDRQQFISDLWAREQLDCTGFEQGVVIPPKN